MNSLTYQFDHMSLDQDITEHLKSVDSQGPYGSVKNALIDLSITADDILRKIYALEATQGIIRDQIEVINNPSNYRYHHELVLATYHIYLAKAVKYGYITIKERIGWVKANSSLFDDKIVLEYINDILTDEDEIKSLNVKLEALFILRQCDEIQIDDNLKKNIWLYSIVELITYESLSDERLSNLAKCLDIVETLIMNNDYFVIFSLISTHRSTVIKNHLFE